MRCRCIKRAVDSKIDYRPINNHINGLPYKFGLIFGIKRASDLTTAKNSSEAEKHSMRLAHKRKVQMKLQKRIKAVVGQKPVAPVKTDSLSKPVKKG